MQPAILDAFLAESPLPPETPAWTLKSIMLAVAVGPPRLRFAMRRDDDPVTLHAQVDSSSVARLSAIGSLLLTLLTLVLTACFQFHFVV